MIHTCIYQYNFLKTWTFIECFFLKIYQSEILAWIYMRVCLFNRIMDIVYLFYVYIL